MLAALGIGFVTGLRCFTGVAAVAWALHLGWLTAEGPIPRYLSDGWSLFFFSALAVGEYFADQWPKTPSRVSSGPLLGRIAMGAVSGACLWSAAGRAPHLGALTCAGGAIAGAFTGYQVRGWLVQEKKVSDLLVGLAEDVLCLGLSYGIVSVR